MSVEQQVAWLEQTVGVRRLHDRAIVEVSGDDAATWLQGQLTNQLEGLEPGGSVYGFILSLKGRVMADVWVLARDTDFWLDVPASEVSALLERLDRYIIMEDVDLTHRDDVVIFTAQGPHASRLEAKRWPSDLLGLGGTVSVFPTAEADTAWTTYLHEATELGGGEIGDEAWTRAFVKHGQPRFGSDFSDDTYPQETGLTDAAVSFNKGCYVGQETVVMLQNRGKAPKVLWQWAIDTTEAPARGTPITKDGANVGVVTSAVEDRGAVVALGFLKRGHDPGPASTWRIGDAAASPTRPVGCASA
ncbi:MAG: hypothetical protein AAGF92_24265 [Myxococcota bacterium]